MGIKEWYKNTMEDDIARLDKRYFLFVVGFINWHISCHGKK